MDFKGLMFSFAHGSHGSHGFRLLRSFGCESWWVPLLATKKIREICEIHVRLLFLNHIAKIQHFIFPTHRCSLLLTDTHRLSLINIRVLPNGRKYRILAEDWTPCSSCCIHSSAAARRAGCILLSISSDGLLPRPGRNPENRAGLTPAWCNFVNPFSIMLNVECWMLNFEHESLESNESFVFKQLIRVIRVIRVPKKR